MALNINGTTGISGVDGSVSAPAVTGTDSNTGITFPSADTIKFSTNGVERMSITDSGVTGTGVGGKFASYAIICDQKANTTVGGVFNHSAWRTRDLNTELTDEDGIVSISSNQFTLQTGSYLIEAQAPAYKINRHQITLYQTSGTQAHIAYGTNEFASASYDGVTSSHLKTRVTIGSATTYEIRHYCQSASSSTSGLGLAMNFGNVEIYTIVKIFKEA